MSSFAVKQALKEYLPGIERAIKQELEQRKHEIATISPHLMPVLTAMQELAAGGKRLRGLLTILGYVLSRVDDDSPLPNEIYRAAAVMELFHLGLLIHDDVMDSDYLRRGVATVHARYPDRHLGESIAICAGDFTFAWGLEMTAGLAFPREQVYEAIKVWGKYFGRVGYGQILDVIGEQRGDTTEEEVLQVLHLKSGEYTCVLPLQFGAALAGADKAKMKWLANYGMSLGWVFQLRDDWLSEWGDSSKTGKPVGNDARNGRKSYATLYGRSATEKAIKEHWDKGRACIQTLQGRTLKVEVLDGLLEWMATREN